MALLIAVIQPKDCRKSLLGELKPITGWGPGSVDRKTITLSSKIMGISDCQVDKINPLTKCLEDDIRCLIFSVQSSSLTYTPLPLFPEVIIGPWIITTTLLVSTE